MANINIQSTPRFDKKYAVYKPNKAGAGSAAQFDFNKEKKCVFAEVAKQKPPTPTDQNAVFDWSAKLTIKLNVTDIAKLLVVLGGRAPTVELFHDPNKSKFVTEHDTKNTTASITKGTSSGYFFKVSQQATTGAVTSVQVIISEDEAIVLKLLLEDAIKKSYEW